MRTLYGKDSKGDLRVWSIYTEGAEVVVKHGKLGGKVQEKRYTAEGKSAGRSNSTTPEQQAILEAEAKYVKQLKSGYFPDKDDALEYVPVSPMKAQNYNAYSHKIVYPCLGQIKANGQRMLIDKDGVAWSKQGEPLELPAHWQGVKELAINCSGLDGEIYSGLESEGGLSLQRIISAFRKPNADTPKLQYWVYDIPNQSTMQHRNNTLRYLAESKPDCVVLVDSVEINNQLEADSYFDDVVKQGYEGVVYRNLDGVYEFGKRSYNLIKRKSFEDFEALVLSVSEDKNSCGVMSCEFVNGKGQGVVFKCLMRKDADATVNLRLYENAKTLIGKAITVSMECLSDDGIPTKPVGMHVRETLNGTFL